MTFSYDGVVRRAIHVIEVGNNTDISGDSETVYAFHPLKLARLGSDSLMAGAAAKWPLSYVYPPEIDVKNEPLLSWERPVEGKATTTRSAKQRHKIRSRTEHLFQHLSWPESVDSGVSASTPIADSRLRSPTRSEKYSVSTCKGQLLKGLSGNWLLLEKNQTAQLCSQEAHRDQFLSISNPIELIDG